MLYTVRGKGSINNVSSFVYQTWDLVYKWDFNIVVKMLLSYRFKNSEKSVK